MQQIEWRTVTIHDEIKKDLKKLGIIADVVHLNEKYGDSTYSPGGIQIIFKTKCDMNFYKIAGKFSTYWWLEYKVEE